MNSPATIALGVGHSRLIGQRREGGAQSVSGASEWTYNADFARMIAVELHDTHGLLPVIIDLYEGNGYSSAQRWLAAHLRSLGNIKLAVELHFNWSDTPAASGHEWLCWHASKAGHAAAMHLHLAMCAAFPELPARGVKPRNSGHRGAEFLRLTHCPAVIAEPFFGSCPRDWMLATGAKITLARAMAAGIAASQSPSLL